jgi:uncharacterized membrane protein HdeD (DUF308 family)
MVMTEVRSVLAASTNINADELARRWWVPLARGIAAVVFGILTFINPGISLIALVILFGAYAFMDGVFNLILAFRHGQEGRRWGSLVFAGIVGIGAGLATLFWPGITALTLLMFIGAWAVITGIAQIAAAVRLRKEIEHEWLLGLAGVLSVVFGVLLFAFPGAGALAVVLWIGAYAIVLGGLLVALALKLRSWGHRPSRRAPIGGVPQAA